MDPLRLHELVSDGQEDIFAGIDYYSCSNQPYQQNLSLTARFRPKKHLALSSDSPFNDAEPQSDHLKTSKQRAVLKQEVANILNERESIRGRQTKILEDTVRSPIKNQLDETIQKPNIVPKVDQKSNKGERAPKFRPLTGRIDCPNCSCDLRRSVCSLCIRLDRRASIFSGCEDRSSSNYNDDKKRCTLKELRQRYAFKPEQEARAVSDRVVPGRVYTISKALDEKRTKLAQAITDLQLMKDQLKEKGNRLDEERKIVQLYKDQWRYGPSIGGLRSSSRERLGHIQQQRNYESRLDPQLARDSKAIEGFRHIEPGMRLRQYDKKTNYQPLSSSKRSKSLDSLRRPKATTVNKGQIPPSKNLAIRNKSSSDADLSSPPERIEEVDVSDTSPPASVADERLEEEVQDEEVEEDKNGTMEATKVQKVAWIPVFGETEIKTVKQKPTVKISVLESSKRPVPASRAEARSILKQSTTVSNKSKEPKTTNDRLVGQANRKLKFASDLLSQEREDSTTKNQLVIKKVSQKLQSTEATDALPEEHDKKKDINNELKIREMLLIEEQLNEHQKQITKLVEMQQSSTTDPGKNSCCNHQATHSSNKVPLGNRSLINNLRDRLNKTKTRLSKNLESEREKYMRLKLKVDTSLRKQSDLEKENELLKQSLSQCIDTCLKDITQTFESLSNSLSESVGSSNNRQPVGDKNGSDLLEIYSTESSNLLLKNAAQVMNDNNKIKEMKNRMDAVMEQRREIFNELSKEKQKSNQLELQLKRSQDELNYLLSAKQRLELKLQQKETSHLSPIIPSTSSSSSDPTFVPPEASNDIHPEPLESTSDDTFSGSIDRYRSYIKSLSPDMATLRQERKLILSEFDNIKKMLSEINTDS